jgi:hypothetical protein
LTPSPVDLRLQTEGVEIVQGDLSDFGALSAALKGITEAFFAEFFSG